MKINTMNRAIHIRQSYFHFLKFCNTFMEKIDLNHFISTPPFYKCEKIQPDIAIIKINTPIV